MAWVWLRGVPVGESRWQSLWRDDTTVQTRPTCSPQAQGKGWVRAGCHIQGSRIDGWDGSRTPTDAADTGPSEDVECRGWKALGGTPGSKAPGAQLMPRGKLATGEHSSGLTGKGAQQAGKAQGRGHLAHRMCQGGQGTGVTAHGTRDMARGTRHLATGCTVGDAAPERGTRTRGHAAGAGAASWGQVTGDGPGGAAGDTTCRQDRGTGKGHETHGYDTNITGPGQGSRAWAGP